jgi:hypothetical protein
MRDRAGHLLAFAARTCCVGVLSAEHVETGLLLLKPGFANAACSSQLSSAVVNPKDGICILSALAIRISEPLPLEHRESPATGERVYNACIHMKRGNRLVRP